MQTSQLFLITYYTVVCVVQTIRIAGFQTHCVVRGDEIIQKLLRCHIASVHVQTKDICVRSVKMASAQYTVKFLLLVFPLVMV